jgi:hypothetical protein
LRISFGFYPKATPQHSVDPPVQIWDARVVFQSKLQPPPTAAEARAARRRAGWKIVVVDSFAEAEAETRAYWRAASPAERLNALEKLREPFYGKDQIGGRLQRFLEVVPAE